MHNAFYSAECKSMVLFFEDSMSNGSDSDFNDIIVTISDNIVEKDVVNFVLPKYAIITDSGTPELVETSTLFE